MRSHRLLIPMAITAALFCVLPGCGGGAGGDPAVAVEVPGEDTDPGGTGTPFDPPVDPPGEPAPEESFAQRVLHLTNLERRAEGLAPLRGELHLDAAAQAHAEDMAAQDYFDHQSLDGRSPWDRLRDAGYTYNTAGENIAAGQPTAEQVVGAWMNSPGHRANILNPSFRELGVGYAWEEGDTFPGPYGYRHYWVQDFGAHNPTFPLVIEDEALRTTDRVVSIYLYGESWADEMLVSEEPGFAGATWVPFAPEISWELSDGNGSKQVCARLRRGADETSACDSIWLE